MSYSKSIAVVFTAVVCSTAIAADAGAQSRGRSPGGGPTVGRAVPRAIDPRVGIAPRIIAPRIIGVAPYRPYFYPYRSRITLGFNAGFGYPYAYGYPYGYGYPYAYGYPYGSYGYPYGAYGGYAPPPAGYMTAAPSAAYGGVRIQGAPRDAQVFADGYYVGIVDDFDGTFQHLNLEAGAHQIEIRAAGRPPIAFDVNVQPGQTVTYHADMR
jgi:hypothetical protein